jgi:predicted permease
MCADLDEIFDRDVGRGLSPSRARIRYAANMLASAGSMARWRLRVAGPGLGSLLDVKLGIRMLRKHPALTGVAVLALSIGIPVGLVPHHMKGLYEVTLPFDDGERIVELRAWDVEAGRTDRRVLHDFHAWRGSLQSFSRIGAARSGPLNVVDDEGRASPAAGAEVTASTFEILRVSPLLGRRLVEADEEPGAPDVVVIGYDLWRSRFGGDPDVLGRPLRIGRVSHEIVGVMPEGFLFPLRDNLWIPLRTGSVVEPRAGPELLIFARPADGVTEEQVLRQMESLHAGQVERFPAVLEDVRPQIASYVDLVTRNAGSGEDLVIMAVWQIFTLILLAVACGNVGTLVLARTTARSGELAIRTALGASRSRIVTQLFAESLVLALLATGAGLALAYYVAERFDAMAASTNELPFWFDFSLNHRTVLAALALGVFCAGIAGVVPAVKATGGKIQGSLQRAASGRSGVRFGGVTSALIVVEVALGVASLFGGGIALLMAPRETERMEIGVERLLTAQVRVRSPAGLPTGVEEGPDAYGASRVASVHREIVRRLSSEPRVRGAALTGTLPAGMHHPTARIELDGGDRGDDGSGYRVLLGRVGVGYLEALGAPVVQGRTFRESDLEAYEQDGDAPVIVDTTFVDRVLHGRNPIGQRVRYVARADEEPGRWHEVVGVVGQAGMPSLDLAGNDAGLYHPIAPGYAGPLWIALRVDGDPTGFVPRLREVVAGVDPTVLIEQPMSLSDLLEESRLGVYWTLLAVGVVAGIAIVLSVAGLYALMSFTVAQRTREIGVRAALGADARRITWLIARRAMLQLTVGIALGTSGSLLIVGGAAPDLFAWLEGANLALLWAAGGVLLIGALACVLPTRRGLRIQPMDALRADG